MALGATIFAGNIIHDMFKSTIDEVFNNLKK